jgi:hypothetical protein
MRQVNQSRTVSSDQTRLDAYRAHHWRGPAVYIILETGNLRLGERVVTN